MQFFASIYTKQTNCELVVQLDANQTAMAIVKI